MLTLNRYLKRTRAMLYSVNEYDYGDSYKRSVHLAVHTGCTYSMQLWYCPCVGDAPRNVKWGDFLGAGSFGKVRTVFMYLRMFGALSCIVVSRVMLNEGA